MDSCATAGIWTTDQLAGSPLIVRFGVSTDAGAVRSLNEDSWLAAAPLFLIADGMGGHSSGARASSLVAEYFAGLVERHTLDAPAIAQGIEECDEMITALAADLSPAPGTTLILAALISEGGRPYWLIANVGDSRAYLVTGSDVQPVSHDHSVVQELLDSGQLDASEVARHPERHVVTRALGGGSDSRPDFSMVPVPASSRLVLCSDGITSELTSAEFNHLALVDAEPLAVAAGLVTAALESGGRDNATALVVDVVSAVAEPASGCEDTVPTPRSGP